MKRPKKAIALAVALTFMAALMVGGVPQMQRSITNNRASFRDFNKEKAFWLAEAGLHEARYAIANDTLDTWDRDGNVYSIEVNSGDDKYIAEVKVLAGGTEFEVSADGLVKALGNSSAFTKNLTLDARKTTQSVPGSNAGTLFTKAVLTKGDLNLTMGTVDGDIATAADFYMSRWNAALTGSLSLGPNGDFADTSSCVDWQGINQCKANMENNNTLNNDLEQEEIDLGQARVPEDLKNMSYTSPSIAYETGSVTLAAGKHKIPSVNIGGDGVLTIEGPSEVYVPGNFGTYGTGAIIFDGKVKVYTDGNIKINNSGTTTTTGNSEDVLIFTTGQSTQTVEILGDAVLQAAIYAPNADVSITGSSQLVGAVVSNTIDVNSNCWRGPTVDYDTDLGDFEVEADVEGVEGETETVMVFENWVEA